MTLKYADRVLETTTTTGTGAINLDGPTPGAQSFVGGVGNAAKVAYTIEDGTDWESGIGTVTAGTPDTLSRDVVLESSNSDALVNWGSGTRNVFLGASSHMMLWRDENKNDVNGVGSSGGTGNAHTITLTPAPLAYSDKMIIRWRAPADNAGNVTANANDLGAKSYVNNDLTEFPAGLIKAGTIQEAVYNASENRFERTAQLVNPASFATSEQGGKADAALPASAYKVTKWEPWTPTITGFGTVANVGFRSRRVGENLEFEGKFTVGTLQAILATFSLGFDGVNGGLEVSADAISGYTIAGFAAISTVGGSPFFILKQPGASIVNFSYGSSAAAGLNPMNGSGSVVAGTIFSVKGSVPIQGW